MAQRSGLGQDELRRANVSALLSRVHISGPTSRAALTQELGLNRSTVGDLTARLESLGLISEELPTAGRRAGRPSLVVVPRHDVTVLAVGLDVDRITMALVGLGGAVLERRTRVHQRGEHDVEHVVETVSQMSRDILASDNASAVRCLGVGVSVPGAVRASDGLVRFAPNLGWSDAPFTELLAKELGMEVTAGNDANLGALAEHLRGAATGFDEVAYISGSVGIGGGFLVGGRELSGAQGYAGEIGHLPIGGNGLGCRCGATGCWETLVGENQLLTGAGRLPGGGPPAVAEVITAAGQGDTRAETTLCLVAEHIGLGLRAVVNIFNPEVIVLGGLLAQVWLARTELVIKSLQPDLLISHAQQVVVHPAALGEDSSLLGAAELAFTPLLADPLALAPAS